MRRWRWQCPERGLLQPEDFLEVAGQTGLILPLGARVLHAACHRARSWNEAEAQPLRICVNLSPRQLRDGGMADTVAEALDASGLPPHLLEVEIARPARCCWSSARP